LTVLPFNVSDIIQTDRPARLVESFEDAALGIHVDLIGVTNDQVHAAGAFDVDFNTDVAARSRATPGSAMVST
jgi:hypothetical protein